MLPEAPIEQTGFNYEPNKLKRDTMKFGQTTFGAWLIANYEIVSTVALFAIYVICFFATGVSDMLKAEGEAVWLLLLMGALGVMIAKTFFYVPVASQVADWMLIILNIVWIVLLYSKLGDIGAGGFVSVMLVEVVISFVWAFMLARSTYRNFDEVVSLRMLYRNSRVDLFSEALAYTVNRFAAVFCNTNGLLLLATAIIALASNKEALASFFV